MINFRASVPTSILFLAFAWGCSDGRTAGNSTQTENTAARSISVDSILPEWNRSAKASTIATLRLNAANFDFSQTDSAGRDLDVVKADGTHVPFEIIFWDKSASLGRLHVRLDSSLLTGGARFEFRWNQPLARRSDSAKVWGGITDSQRLELNSVLVDQFENGSLTCLLPDSSSWFTGKSDSGSISSFGLVSAPPNRTGTVLHMAYSARLLTGQYVYASIRLANSPRVFRSLDSLEFWARGSGSFSPALEHMITSKFSHKAWRSRDMDTGWQRYRIRPQDFDSATATSGNVGWTAIRDTIDHLTFLIGGSGDLWIDDIRLYGIDRNDLR